MGGELRHLSFGQNRRREGRLVCLAPRKCPPVPVALSGVGWETSIPNEAVLGTTRTAVQHTPWLLGFLHGVGEENLGGARTIGRGGEASGARAREYIAGRRHKKPVVGAQG